MGGPGARQEGGGGSARRAVWVALPTSLGWAGPVRPTGRTGWPRMLPSKAPAGPPCGPGRRCTALLRRPGCSWGRPAVGRVGVDQDELLGQGLREELPGLTLDALEDPGSL